MSNSTDGSESGAVKNLRFSEKGMLVELNLREKSSTLSRTTPNVQHDTVRMFGDDFAVSDGEIRNGFVVFSGWAVTSVNCSEVRYRRKFVLPLLIHLLEQGVKLIQRGNGIDGQIKLRVGIDARRRRLIFGGLREYGHAEAASGRRWR